jgi:PAS domain S-box-containing protein
MVNTPDTSGKGRKKPTRDDSSARIDPVSISEIVDLLKSFDSDWSDNLSLVLQFMHRKIGGGFTVYHAFAESSQQVQVRLGVACPAKFRRFGRSAGRVCYEAFDKKMNGPVVFEDLRTTSYWQSDPDLRRYGLKAFIGCPVYLDGHVAGSIAVYDNQPRKFGALHLALAEMIAQIVTQLDQLRQAEIQLNTKFKYEHMLAEITACTISRLSIDRCMAQCLDVIGQSMKADGVVLYNEDLDGQGLVHFADWWRDPGSPTSPSSDPAGLASLPMMTRVLLNNETYCCNDRDALPEVNARKLLKRRKISSFLIVPLRCRQFVHGVCFVGMSNAPYKWHSTEIEVLETVAQILAQRMMSRTMAHRLDESEALVYQMFQLSPVAIYRVDYIRQRFLAVNEYMCRATGYSKDEFLSLKPIHLLTPKSRKLYRKRLKAMAEGKPVSNNVDFEMITKSGAVEWVSLHIRHLFDDGRIIGAMVVAHFVTEQKKVREELAVYRRELETLVQARTAELAKTNQQLREEIEQRKRTASELRASSERLQEMNTAMRVILDKRIEDHQRMEELIRLNLKELIDPFLNRLENSGLRRTQKQLLEVIRMNLEEVVGSSMPEFSNKYYMFSPNELQVANLIRQGKTSKEVARLLNLSVRTVDSYRDSIRKKLGLKNKKINLRTYLASI